RLLENTSNEGFLRAKFSDNVSEDELLRDPAELVAQSATGARHLEVSGDGASLDTPQGDTYENAPLVNFVYEQNQDRMREALERAADIMHRRRFELSALEVFEVGKAWAEADGDIREAMDFCQFYAHEMRLIGRPRLTQHVLGEESYQHYWPRGVAMIIAPWNF